MFSTYFFLFPIKAIILYKFSDKTISPIAIIPLALLPSSKTKFMNFFLCIMYQQVIIYIIFRKISSSYKPLKNSKLNFYSTIPTLILSNKKSEPKGSLHVIL